jgi:peptidoglycan/xylan/chitin deacetylase (PgdA/CDA1 family)
MTYILKYKIEKPTELIRYTFKYIFSILGVKTLEVTEEYTKFDIFYGSIINNEAVLNIQQNSKDLTWKGLIESERGMDLNLNQIQFDIIHAISSFISDKVNYNLPIKAFDSAERLILRESFQFKEQIHEFPIVNKYILFIKDVLKNKFPSLVFNPFLENNKKYAIGLSHDVDFPDKYAPRYSPFLSPGSSIGKHLKMYQKKITATLNRLRDPFPDNHWLFEKIMDSEEKHGFKSTFFFASISKFDSYGTKEDVNYNLKNYRFRNVIEKIKERGFEVGLHASYNAYKALERFQLEKKRIEDVSNDEVVGLRHHGWHLSKNIEQTFEFHEKAGFNYDSSLSFNESLGFRYNIAFPFYPWKLSENRPLQVMQLPVFCMDGNLFNQKIETSQAIAQIIKYIDTIKRYEGIGIIDWHVRTSYPTNNNFTEWGKAYQAILEYIAKDQEAWVTNLKDIQLYFMDKLK